MRKIEMKITRPNSSDLLAGISVALLALPQGLAYAELAGMPAKYGLYAAALPSLLAALFASSPYLQTGPVALTALLTFGALQGLAEPQSMEFIELAALLALMVGVIRLALGLFKFGKITNILTDAVVIGFTSGAAIVIIFSQLPKSLGVRDATGGVISAGWDSLFSPSQWEIGAILFSIFTIVIIFGGRALHRLFPGVLIAVVSGILISQLGDYSGQTVGELPRGFIQLKFQYEWGAIVDLIFPAIIIAIVGFAEPASIARTFAREENMKWNANKEFISQGIANLASAASNAFPVGGSFGRSALNKVAGATTPWAGAFTGAFVLAALPFIFLLENLPSAILGATVIGAVIKLVKIAGVWEIFHESTSQGLVAIGTFMATIVTSPRIERGIVIGLVFAFIAWAQRKINSKNFQ